MTDEEKAENFVKENCCEFCINKDDCEMGYIDCNTKEGVLYGLAEGRKENEELKEKYESNKIAISSLIEKSNKEINELIAQIEQMKCCENCKHYSFGVCDFFGYDEELKCLNDRHGWELTGQNN